MMKQFLRFGLTSFGVASTFALGSVLFRGSPAQAQIIVDGYLNEYGVDTAPTLEANTTGPAVEDLQIFLNELGYYNENISGAYDAGLQEAVQEFQTDYGLEATGYVDDNTWLALSNINEDKVFEEEDEYNEATGEYYDYEEGY